MDVTWAPRIAACLFWPCFFCLVCVGRVVVSLWVLARAVLRWAVAACSSPMRVCTTDSNVQRHRVFAYLLKLGTNKLEQTRR